MISKPRRRLAALAGLAACGLGLAACHPPHQQDSEVGKVDTATGFSAPSSTAAEAADSDDAQASTTETDTVTATRTVAADDVEGTPFYQSCMDDPARLPDIITLDCSTRGDNLQHIEWDSWGETEATGHGVHTVGGRADEVEIRLADPVPADYGAAFQTVYVDGAEQPIL